MSEIRVSPPHSLAWHPRLEEGAGTCLGWFKTTVRNATASVFLYADAVEYFAETRSRPGFPAKPKKVRFIRRAIRSDDVRRFLNQPTGTLILPDNPEEPARFEADTLPPNP